MKACCGRDPIAAVFVEPEMNFRTRQAKAVFLRRKRNPIRRIWKYFNNALQCKLSNSYAVDRIEQILTYETLLVDQPN